eukprot:13010329-Heterocapsa_arctica.AAC.1
MASADMASSGQTNNQSSLDVTPSLLYVCDPGLTYAAFALVFSSVKVPGSRFQPPPIIHGTLLIVAARCSDILVLRTLLPFSGPGLVCPVSSP